MPDKKNEDGGAILTPEDFDSTRNTELAACLITLGFPLLNNTPGFSRVIGEGIAGRGCHLVVWETQPGWEIHHGRSAFALGRLELAERSEQP